MWPGLKAATAWLMPARDCPHDTFSQDYIARVNTLGYERGNNIFTQEIAQVTLSPAHPLSPHHRDTVAPCSSETSPRGGAGRGSVWWHPHGANTPRYSRGGQSRQETTAHPVIAPAVGFQLALSYPKSWLNKPTLDGQPQQAVILAMCPSAAPSPSFPFCNQFLAEQKGTDDEPSAHSSTQEVRAPCPGCAQLALTVVGSLPVLVNDSLTQ